MNRKFSLAIHDLRVSEGENAVTSIKSISAKFRIPLTVHLVFDKPLNPNTLLFDFIIENTRNGSLEIVFHGLTHLCERKVFRWIAFYHKYQAEYLIDSEELRAGSAFMYKQLSDILGNNPGICPPCWIATRKNIAFFNSLKPLYIETLLNISVNRKKSFIPVVSLASPDDRELYFLKILAKIIYVLSLFFRVGGIRLAIHVCDLSKPQSMLFFGKIISSLQKHHFRAVLQKELI